MSWKIEIHKAKPNPAGKDKAGNYPIANQLLGEWVDLKNVGDSSVQLSVLSLAHLEFDSNCVPQNAPKKYWTGSSNVRLSPGEIVRVHTGRSRDEGSMTSADRQGVQYHAYADLGAFVLNNKCGDELSVWWKGEKCHQDDVAHYRPNPPEGKVLQRVGKILT